MSPGGLANKKDIEEINNSDYWPSSHAFSSGATLLPIHAPSPSRSNLDTASLMPSVDKVKEKKSAKDSKLSNFASAMPSHRPSAPLSKQILDALQNDRLMLLVYTALSFFTRLYRIGSNHKVVWDEAHFGKFASYYLRHTFYFDVHPPLGKILVSLAGWLSGYDGSFEFDSGSDYPDNVPFVRMRIIMALYGIAIVPIAYMTAQSMHWNWRAKHLFTLMVLLDHGLLTISRFILLDSMLLMFTFSVVLGLVRFHRQQHVPFSFGWWFWLFFTGVSIGCVTGVKMVGLFAMSLVGLYTIEDLWNKFGDVKMPVRTQLKHWCARILALIIVPITIYVLSFKLHFALLYKSGPGDAQMSSLFQSNLEGSELGNYPLEAAYGSKVSFKNVGYGGGLLHSHIQTFPEGSQEQQVTCYHYKDTNNHFMLMPPPGAPPLPNVNDTSEPPRMLRSGDSVRFLHVETGHVLRTHEVPAPISKEFWEVSGALDENTYAEDEGDVWRIIVKDDLNLGHGEDGSPIRTMSSRLLFYNEAFNCYMRSGTVILPDWGWKQNEVTCVPEEEGADNYALWNIENHWNDRLPSENVKHNRSPFFRDFMHLNVVMMMSNNALVPDEDKFDTLASSPTEWPWIYRGLRMNGWGNDQDKYFLMGNPFVWWGSTASLHVAVVLLAWYLMRRQRRIFDMSPATWDEFLFGLKVGGIGWLLHYGPFLLMGRVTYIHHYLPTVYFAVIVFVHLLDHYLWNDASARLRFDLNQVTKAGRIAPSKRNPWLQDPSVPVQGRPLSDRFKNVSFLVITGLLVFVFMWFRAISFGLTGDIANWHGLKWRRSWNIY